MKDTAAIYEEILEKLEKIIMLTESMHTPSLSFGTGKLMHTKEIHTIQAIGRYPGINVTRLAEQMDRCRLGDQAPAGAARRRSRPALRTGRGSTAAWSR